MVSYNSLLEFLLTNTYELISKFRLYFLECGNIKVSNLFTRGFTLLSTAVHPPAIELPIPNRFTWL